MYSLRCIFFSLLLKFAASPQLRAQKQDRELLIYNTALGGVTAGIGAVINREKDVNWKRAFVKGLWQGSVGGMLNYGGKKTLYLVNKKQQLAYAWPANLLHAAGNSIIENAALRKPFLRYWNFDLYFLRLDFSFAPKEDFRIRFLPVTLFSVPAVANRAVFDLSTTLKTGQVAFRSKDSMIRRWGGEYLGFAYGRAFQYVNNSEKYWLIPHEIVHLYQYRQFMVLNSWIDKPAKKYAGPKLHKLFKDHLYADIPYFFGLYPLEGYHDAWHYFRNYFEFEAQRFSTNKTVWGR